MLLFVVVTFLPVIFLVCSEDSERTLTSTEFASVRGPARAHHLVRGAPASRLQQLHSFSSSKELSAARGQHLHASVTSKTGGSFVQWPRLSLRAVPPGAHRIKSDWPRNSAGLRQTQHGKHNGRWLGKGFASIVDGRVFPRMDGPAFFVLISGETLCCPALGGTGNLPRYAVKRRRILFSCLGGHRHRHRHRKRPVHAYNIPHIKHRQQRPCGGKFYRGCRSLLCTSSPFSNAACQTSFWCSSSSYWGSASSWSKLFSSGSGAGSLSGSTQVLLAADLQALDALHESHPCAPPQSHAQTA